MDEWLESNKKLMNRIDNGLLICIAIIAWWIAYTFRPNLILDLFWDKVDQTMIEAEVEKDDFGQFVGLPAGEGVAKLTDIDQFYNLQTTYYGTVKPDYITFETDSIIPLGLYRLNSDKDAHIGGHNSMGHYISSNTILPIYTQINILGCCFYYNQYYMVELPDGNYVPAYLDDTYYMKYRLTGKVQLPVGIVDRMPSGGRNFLQPYLDEYGLSDDRILVMYSQKRYKDYKTLYAIMVFLSFWGTILVLAWFEETIKKNILRKMKSKK